VTREYDMFAPDSMVILFREVLNDAVVGRWSELDGVQCHSLEGLKDWMRQQNSPSMFWDTNKLRVSGFQEMRGERVPYWGLIDYGLRLQFWIPRNSSPAGTLRVRDENGDAV